MLSMTHLVRIYLIVVIAAAALATAARAAEIVTLESPAAHIMLVDADTGTVLLEKRADEAVPPASMSKLMTVYLVFERLANGSLGLSDTFPVSEYAWRMGGSKMFVRVNSRVSIEDLLRGVIVQSGNDASVVIAEGLSGSEKSFASEMTQRAIQLGLDNSSFKNASGWPDEGHYMSVRDIATLSRRLIKEFPQYYGLFAEKTFTYNGISQGNRNPLLYKDFGADGLKTGHTQKAGYGIAASVARNGRRLILVIHGLTSVNQRAREAERLFDWGFREFGNFTLFKAGEPVDKADVWLGTRPQVDLVLKNDLTVTLSRKARRAMTVKVVYDGPLPAPISAGEEIAQLVIGVPDVPDRVTPLYAGTAIARHGVFGRLQAAVGYLLWGGSRR